MLRFTRRETRFASLILTALVMSGCPGPHCTSDQVEIEGACYSICDDGTAVCTPDGGHADVRFDLGLMETSTDAGDIVDTTDSPDVVDVPDVPTCGAGETMCGDHCVSTETSPENCGACNRVCPGVVHGTATCAAGVCDFTCATGFHACGGVCSDNTSALSCGTSCMACPAPTGADATCTSGACGWECRPGYDRVGAGCELSVPRPVAPLSTATVTSQRPTFRWVLATGTDGASIEVCRDRAFTLSCQTVDASGTSGTVSTALTRGVWFWRLRGRSGGTVGMRTGPVWEFLVGARTAPVDTNWGSFLDLNGDGYADLAVGADNASGGSGRVHIYLGSATGLSTTASTNLMPPAADGTFPYFGHSVASAGDLNGDGYADLVVGENSAAGRVHVYLGSASGAASTPSFDIAAPAGDGAGPYFGASVSGAGDVNGDGYADIVIGATNADSRAGRAHVYFGGAGGVSTMPDVDLVAPSADGTNAHFGCSVASVGDANGDGYGDVVVGANGAAGGGRAHLYFGGPSGTAATPTLDLSAPGADGTSASFGASVAGAGDVNGDGYADLVVGASGAASFVGRAHIYLGGAAGVASTPIVDLAPTAADGAMPYFGISVASAGDVDGDGFADVAVGAAYATPGGRAHVHRGLAGGVATTAAFDLIAPAADGTNARFGVSVAGVGDVNGDGFSDVAVGASNAATGTGAAHIYVGGASGLSTTSVDLVAPTGDGTTTGFGISVARADVHVGGRTRAILRSISAARVHRT